MQCCRWAKKGHLQTAKVMSREPQEPPASTAQASQAARSEPPGNKTGSKTTETTGLEKVLQKTPPCNTFPRRDMSK